MRKRHEFPNPVQVSPGRRLWSEQVVNDWIAEKLRGLTSFEGCRE
jgi:predicted DNA-binding transcriptional regulator AlpA